MEASSHPARRHLILYDGVCGLCNRFVQFVLRRDRRGRFVYAALQSEFATERLRENRCDAKDLDTVYVFENYETSNERLLLRSEAVLLVLTELGGLWTLTRALRLLPTRLRNRCYDFIASRRYRWFGQLPACAIPSPEQRHRFLD